MCVPDSNDQRLMQETPDILALSNALQQPAGQRASNGVVCIGGAIGGVLAAARHPQAAITVASLCFICLIVTVNVLLRKCGTSLIRTIDQSLQRSSGKSGVVGAGNEKGGDSALLAAKTKLKTAMMCCALMAVSTTAQLLFALLSKYGMIVPLLLFCIPMGFGPSIWAGLNIQLHAGRSRPYVSPNSSPREDGKRAKTADVSGLMKSSDRGAATHARAIGVEPSRVVPTEAPAVP